MFGKRRQQDHEIEKLKCRMGALLVKHEELREAYQAASEMIPALERRVVNLETSGFKENRHEYMKTLNALEEGMPEVPPFGD